MWAKTNLLLKFNGDDLFGLKDLNTQKQLTLHQKFTCSFKDWNNLNTMELLYLNHLKTHTLANIDWYKLFENWSIQSSDIIEIQSELSNIYPPNHIFNDRELRAWRALIIAAGGTNITPFDKKESMVL